VQRVLTTVTLLGLLVATSAAFAITEHLKQIKSPVFGTEVSAVFSPVCHCATSTATIQIRLRHPDRVTVTIVDSAGHEVATLASDRPMPAHRKDHFVWDGRTDARALVPDGVYYPWVHLTHARQTFQFANKINVDKKAPTVLSATGLKHVLLAAPGRAVAISYTFSEKAHAVVYLGRRPRPIIVGRVSGPRNKVKWSGRLHGRPLRAGRYVLSIGAQDLAGNETPASARKQVIVFVRYVVLTPSRITVRAGRRMAVRVETAAKRYTWRLGHRHGSRHRKLLRLRAPTTPGTYRLVVAEHGHTTTAVVRVRTK
jgi:hypothetical protein